MVTVKKYTAVGAVRGTLTHTRVVYGTITT